MQSALVGTMYFSFYTRASKRSAMLFPNQQWMEREQRFIASLPLSQVALPGSHDAGTWDIDCCSPWSPERVEWWAPLARAFPWVTMRYAITQNYPVEEQAMRGIRYFDMRVCAYVAAAGREYRFVHGMLGGDFVEGVRRLCQFARENPKEILILDVRFTENFTADDHVFMQRTFAALAGERLATVQHFDPNTPVRDFWEAGRNLVVLYPNADPRYGLWPANYITTKWPHTTVVPACLVLLDASLRLRNVSKPQLHCLQACLTPDTAWVLRNPLKTTQQLARLLNAQLVKRLPKWRGKLNCIMVDVIEFPGMVDAVIALNRPVLDDEDDDDDNAAE